MSEEVRPLGVRCNIQCQYCYQNPPRDAGNIPHTYDLDRIKSAIVEEGGDFTLFGGEPLLVPLADLESLWAWGFERSEKNGVHLHDGSGSLDLLDFEELASRALTIALDGQTLRVPALEDYLRILAIHALRHDMIRPLWLTDLAVALEGRPADFDWRRCLGPDLRRTEVATAIALAHQLLGADVTGTPVRSLGPPGARMAVSSGARAWARGGSDLSSRPPTFRALISSLGDRRRFHEEWRLRWDRPIQATIELAAC